MNTYRIIQHFFQHFWTSAKVKANNSVMPSKSPVSTGFRQYILQLESGPTKEQHCPWSSLPPMAVVILPNTQTYIVTPTWAPELPSCYVLGLVVDQELR